MYIYYINVVLAIKSVTILYIANFLEKMRGRLTYFGDFILNFIISDRSLSLIIQLS
jgi:hypothetical protein